MRVLKKKVTELEKCYSLAPLRVNGKKKYAVASEKEYQTYLFSEDGEVEETISEGPGGVMTMEALPGHDGVLIATQMFYSPNNSAQAYLALEKKTENGWSIRKICDLPFVHRFTILGKNGKTFLLAATLKSAHAYKDDWACPGRLWAGEIPTDICENEDAKLELKPILSGLGHNHGYFKPCDGSYALFGTDNGIFKVTAPDSEEWKIEKIFEDKASDMLEADFDGDGEKELLVFSPFHGETFTIYKKYNDTYRRAFVAPEPWPFLHALYPATYKGKEVAIIGYREGRQEILMVYFEEGKYQWKVIDEGTGTANVYCENRGEDLVVIAANRGINEVAMYTITE